MKLALISSLVGAAAAFAPASTCKWFLYGAGFWRWGFRMWLVSSWIFSARRSYFGVCDYERRLAKYCIYTSHDVDCTGVTFRLIIHVDLVSHIHIIFPRYALMSLSHLFIPTFFIFVYSRHTNNTTLYTTARASTSLNVSPKSEALPFLPKPANLEGYVGDVGFDPLRISDYVPMDYLREAELKHSRICMLAWTGWVTVGKFGFTYE